MSIIPIVRPAEMLRVLLKAGFLVLRTRGSHILLQHPITKRMTTVIVHPGDLLRRTIASTLKQAGLSVKELLRLLRE